MTEYTHTSLKTQLETAFADNSDGGITAKTLRDNTIHIIDSIVPIMASGVDNYFKNDIDLRDASVTTATTPIGKVYGQWDDTNVSAICFLTGSDTTNKDDGSIRFFTAPSGSASTTGGPDLVQRMAIESNGQVNIYGSGVVSPALHLQSIHGSGLNLLLDGSTKDIAVPDGTNFQIGHWNDGDYTFTERLTIDSKGRYGFGIAHPEEPFHVRASGDAVRFDSKTSTVNNADILLNKYTGGSTTYGYNDLYAGFGLGVHTAGSGHGYLFVGFDHNRDSKITSAESTFVIDSGGKVGIGNRSPSERLVVGDDLGKISTGGTAFVIGSTHGPAQFVMGSGAADANRSNYSTFAWEGDKNRLTLSTRSDFKKRSDQLVLDSVTGNVGVGTSGVFPKVGVQSTASLTFGDTEFDDVNNGTIALVDSAGTSKTYKIKNEYGATGATEFNAGASRATAAGNFAQIVEGSNGHNGTIYAADSASVRFSSGGYDFSDGVVKLTQAAPGVAGNTTITTAASFDDCTDVNASAAFSGGGDSIVYWNPSFNLHVLGSGNTYLGVENVANTASALYVGKQTNGSGILTGRWSSIGYPPNNDVLKINNSGSLLTNHLTINSIGTVGISTSSPYGGTSLGTDKLHVYGQNTGVIIGNPEGGYSALRLLGSRVSATSSNDTAFIQAGTTAADTGAKLRITRFDSDDSNLHKFDVYAISSTFHGSGIFNTARLNSGNLILNNGWVSNDGGNEGVRVDNTGQVGIGVAAPSYQLELSTNSAAKPTSTLWTATSDERVKENIESIDSATALDKIMDLRPVSFNFIDEYCNCHSLGVDDTHYNFIAQEVADIFPECVVEVGQDLRDHDTGEIIVENMKGLDSHAINIHMLSAIQELKIQLDAANVRISQLESN